MAKKWKKKKKGRRLIPRATSAIVMIRRAISMQLPTGVTLTIITYRFPAFNLFDSEIKYRR